MRVTAAAGSAVLIAALALTGCQSSAPSSSSVPGVGLSMLPTTVPSTEASHPAGDLDGDSEGSADDDGLAAACDVDTIAGVQEVVAQQLAAFKTGDFVAAFALASAQFQAISSAESLRQLITDGRHLEVIDSASHEFVDCRAPNPGQASAVVSVTGRNGRTILLAYQFVLEEGSWHILQSAPMTGHGGSTEAPSDQGQPV
jgi:hypothetical protein